ncbi:hypothetical protein A2797_00725 [candidate division WWE3 bacterium RIFCSPHIGHO2_01_FULL_48_15]|uniref:ART-PolyVal-like domain-containing protein n=1 Tax=candidate division WWE3 bacterium RIFCSPHIGHO2_01_FULL_48_15 TaxID=1802619 RepID=A0A1F4VAK9_UNCKA|nr:MAG: hypothetical protein A2797_00725 [candidate division WWE3 bacterium RIFCSPHIGHO2_01_FULL_48_15]
MGETAGYPKGYREELAKKLKESSKSERPEILNQAKQSVDYWQSRQENISSKQEEVPIDDGFGVFVKARTLYHGSPAQGIKAFNKAEEYTLGKGVYLTSTAEKAAGYAKVRLIRPQDEEPHIYEALIEDAKLLDLRKQENVDKFTAGFKEKLQGWMKSGKTDRGTDLDRWAKMNIEKAIEKITNGDLHSGNLREIAFNLGNWFSNYAQELGYDGLIAYEGGEGGGSEKIGDHDTYLIFNPEKVRITREQKLDKNEGRLDQAA